jgi:hypothetical protein
MTHGMIFSRTCSLCNKLQGGVGIMSNNSYDTLPGTTYHRKRIRRVAGRLGLDFVVTGIKFFNRQLGKE